MSAIKAMVEYVVMTLADKPSSVRVTESENESAVTIEIDVAPEDAGRVIGRQGRTINAVRSLARILATKLNKKVSVELT